jgi:hypothetical protein
MCAAPWIVASGLLLASSAHADPGLTTGHDDTVYAEHVDEAAAGLGRLSERVVGLEKKVDRLSMPDLRAAPTDAEPKRARLEQERQAEFLNQVWTGP